MQSLGIVLMCVAGAVVYGIVHDQVTAHICVEYFTVGHPPVFGTHDPTLLGLGWGIIATWWVGLLLGIPLAVISRAGARPKRSAGSLVRPIAVLLAVMALGALVAGVIGWLLAQSGAVVLVGSIAHRLPADRHVPFIADLWAHSASYLFGLVGGIVVMVQVWHSRGKSDRYETVMGTDVIRDGMFLELWDRSTQKLALEAFYLDADGSFQFERHRADVQSEVEAWFQQEARRRLPPRPET